MDEHEEKGDHDGKIIARAPLAEALQPIKPFSESHLSKLTSEKYHSNESESQMAEAKSAKFREKSIIRRHSSSRALSAQVQRDQSLDQQPSNGFIAPNLASSIHPLSAETKAVPEKRGVEKKAFHEEKRGYEEKGCHEGKIIPKAPLANAHLFKSPLPRESFSESHLSKLTSEKYHPYESESQMTEAKSAKFREKSIIRRHSSSRALSAQVQRDRSLDPQPSKGFIPSNPASSIHPLSAETKAVPEKKGVEKKAFHEEKGGHEEKGCHEGKIIAKVPPANARLFRESLSLSHQSRTTGISRSKPRVLHSKSSPGKDKIELEDAAPKYAAIEKSASKIRMPAAKLVLSVQPGRISEIKPQQTRIIGMNSERYAGQKESQESLKSGGESGARGGRIKVTIGRVDVRADFPPSSQEMRQGTMPADRSAIRLSLDGYLKQRNEGNL